MYSMDSEAERDVSVPNLTKVASTWSNCPPIDHPGDESRGQHDDRSRRRPAGDHPSGRP